MSEELDSLRARVRKDPFDFDARLELGNALRDAERLSEALEEYRRAWALKPEDSRPRDAITGMFKLTGDSTASRGLVLNFMTESLEFQASTAKEAAKSFLLGLGRVVDLSNIVKSDPDIQNRIHAARILGAFAQPETVAVEALASVLDSDNDALFNEAVNAIGSMMSPTAAVPLGAALTSGRPERMLLILDALTRMGPFARDALNDIASASVGQPIEIRTAAANATIALGDKRAIEFMSDMAKAQDKEDRLAAATALADADYQRAESLLLELVNDADQEIREAAAKGLAQRKVEEGGKVLFRLSRSRDALDRIAAAKAYGIYEDPEFVEPLFRMLNDVERSVRFAAAEALAAYPDEAITNRLWNVLETGTPRRQYGAVLALVCRNAPGARDGLIKLLEAPEAELRAAAAWGFGRTGRFRDIPVLQNLLKDQDPAVVQAAKDSIARLSKPEELQKGLATRRLTQ